LKNIQLEYREGDGDNIKLHIRMRGGKDGRWAGGSSSGSCPAVGVGITQGNV